MPYIYISMVIQWTWFRRVLKNERFWSSERAWKELAKTNYGFETVLYVRMYQRKLKRIPFQQNQVDFSKDYTVKLGGLIRLSSDWFWWFKNYSSHPFYKKNSVVHIHVKSQLMGDEHIHQLHLYMQPQNIKKFLSTTRQRSKKEKPSGAQEENKLEKQRRSSSNK